MKSHQLLHRGKNVPCNGGGGGGGALGLPSIILIRSAIALPTKTLFAV
jgi:hypothetical protein